MACKKNSTERTCRADAEKWDRRRFVRVVTPAAVGLIVLPTHALAQRVRCAGCGKVITSQYIEANGKYFHPECFKCAACGFRIDGSYIEHKGKFYHPDCYHHEFSPRCEWCGAPVSDKYFTIDGKVYHESCYVENLAPICAITGQPILGPYVTDWWGTTISAEYKDQVELCDSCGRFALPGHAWKLADGRIQCEVCRETEVTDAGKAAQIVREAAAVLEANGIRFNTSLDDISIVLVDKNQLHELHGGEGDANGLHSVHSETMNGRVIREDTTIYFLYGLPRDMLSGVAAHELFHVWQHENDADGGHADWREGSANVAMRIMLESIHSKLADYHLDQLEENDDPAYGKGYRKAWKYYQDHGISEFLNRVKKKGSGRRKN